MSRKRNLIPTYRLHAATGRAIITVYKPDGSRAEILLPGPYGSDQSRQEYERILAQMRANAGQLPEVQSSKTPDLTLAELVERFMREFVEPQYRHADGEPTREQENFADTVRPLVRLFSSKPVREFTSLDLRTYRESVITGTWRTPEEQAELLKRHGKDGTVCRSIANQRVGRVKRMFRWATEMMLIPASVWHGVQSVSGLRRGRSSARETAPVLPVEPEAVEATLPHCPPVVADVVRVQLLTGARPGELLSIRAVDIDRTGPTWVYRPTRHKTQHAGHLRTIAIGPQAQLILRKYLKPSVEAFLFSPEEQADIIAMTKRENRQTPVQPSQADRRKPNAKRRPGKRFTVTGYAIAIRRACKRANVTPWHPHQLRHTAALLIEREFGAEAARATLGHRTLNQTLHYSGIDTKRAADVAAKIG